MWAAVELEPVVQPVVQRAVGREIQPGDRTGAAVEHGDDGAIIGAPTDSQLPVKRSVDTR